MILGAMHTLVRAGLILALLGIWILAVPLAEATGACPAMSGACEGPCGTTVGILAAPSTTAVLPLVDRFPLQAAEHFPSAPARLPDLPPKSLLRPA